MTSQQITDSPLSMQEYLLGMEFNELLDFVHNLRTNGGIFTNEMFNKANDVLEYWWKKYGDIVDENFNRNKP